MRGIGSINEILTKSAEYFPNKEAVIFGAKKITYRKIITVSDKLAGSLYELGIRRADKVCLWLPNIPEFIYSYFAILTLGAVAVPINTLFKREEAKFVIDDSGAKILICSVDKLDNAEVILGRAAALENIICVPSCGKNTVAKGFYELIDGCNVFGRRVDIEPSCVAEILYTSGTTGSPKGACLTHGSLIANIADCSRAIKIKSKDSFLCILPLFHSFASTVCMLLPFYNGASIVLMRTVRPFKRVIRAVFRNRITVFVAVPSIYKILAEIKLSWYKLIWFSLINPVRICISGAAALSGDILERFEKKIRRPLLEGYGLTEASPVVSLNPLKGKRKRFSVGLALSSLEAKVVDGTGRELLHGDVGELIIKGPSIMKEYYNLKEETAKVLKNGWLRTGDLASIDKEGYIFIKGRKKDMINVRGLNVYPREIEELLYKHPGVREASVVGVPHPHRGEVPIAFVVTDGTVDDTKLTKYLKTNLASYKVPLKVITRKDFPKNAAGKILKIELRKEIENVFVLKKRPG